jgi:hypothetical protein
MLVKRMSKAQVLIKRYIISFLIKRKETSTGDLFSKILQDHISRYRTNFFNYIFKRLNSPLMNLIFA